MVGGPELLGFGDLALELAPQVVVLRRQRTQLAFEVAFFARQLPRFRCHGFGLFELPVAVVGALQDL